MYSRFRKPLKINSFYHIYGQGNNKQEVFISPKEYDYFLELYRTMVQPLVDTYSYCLVPWGFHLALETKAEGNAVSEQFRKFLSKFCQDHNRQNNRSGSLLTKPFKRRELISLDDITEVITGINLFPLRQGLCTSIEDYEWSSFRHLLSNDETDSIVDKQKVSEVFGDIHRLIVYHKMMIDHEPLTDDLMGFFEQVVQFA